MKILTDLHTHTIACTHAYSTLYENTIAAKEKGIELIAMTDHAPAMEDAPHIWHFAAYHNIPSVVNGVKLLKGVELNILNKAGDVDLDEWILKNKIDLAIASIHGVTYDEEPGGDHTETWLNVIKNPHIDILGHSGSPDFAYDIDTVVLAAKSANKCIEINSHTYVARKASWERCREIALACKRLSAPIVVNSDSHFMSHIGDLGAAINMLKEIEFPEELIMNLNSERFINYIEKKKNKKFDFGE